MTPPSAKQFVVIAGNIGVGKSTLVARLAQRWGWQAAHEPNAENPYLADFYKDMSAWGFHSQVFFLGKRLEQHTRICNGAFSVLQDRSVFEDAEIFARNLHLQGHLSERDWRTYYSLYQTMTEIIQPPSLVVYLRANVRTLQQRIAQRNREYEKNISVEYLHRINALYDDWATRFLLSPLMTVDAEHTDWALGNSGLDDVAAAIQARLSAH